MVENAVNATPICHALDAFGKASVTRKKYVLPNNAVLLHNQPALFFAADGHVDDQAQM